MTTPPRHIVSRVVQTSLAVMSIFLVCLFTSAQTTEIKTNTPYLPLAELLKKWEGVPLAQVEEAADKGNPLAQHYLGYCYMEGLRTAPNPEMGAFWYRRALTNGYLASANNLGFAYQHGLLGSNDLSRAIYYYKYAAQRGLAQSEVNLAVLYRDGMGVQKNALQALHWFRLAAAKGHPVAMVEIGRAYRFGRGVDQNLDEAEKWFRKAADTGNALAQLNLGLLYEDEGRQVEAFQFYQRAADQGQTTAMTKLYCCYWDGIGIAPDHAKAMQWLTKAAEARDSWAQYLMGYRYEHPDDQEGSNRVPVPNLIEACQWYRRSADQNYAEAQYCLGLFYLKGQVVNRDEERGLKLVRAAADQGLNDALIGLADLYAQGIGEPRSDQDRPLQLLTRAREYSQLIYRYEYGVGTPRDLVAAAQWYCRAALAGYGSINDKVEFHPSNGFMKGMPTVSSWDGKGICQPIQTGDPNDEVRRVLSFVLKAAQGNGAAALRVGNMYLTGQDAPQEAAKAWLWLTIAAQNGSTAAQAKISDAESAMTADELKKVRQELPALTKELAEVASVLRNAPATNGPQ
jgi:TPR repeat protein